jgi:hypothetical protein
MTLGRLIFRRENGLSYNALGPFRLPVAVILLPLLMMLCMSLVGTLWAKAVWMICMPFNCRVSDLDVESFPCSHAKCSAAMVQISQHGAKPTWQEWSYHGF